jgi:hypothetical protein
VDAITRVLPSYDKSGSTGEKHRYAFRADGHFGILIRVEVVNPEELGRAVEPLVNQLYE